jgi:hypothetical protein
MRRRISLSINLASILKTQSLKFSRNPARVSSGVPEVRPEFELVFAPPGPAPRLSAVIDVGPAGRSAQIDPHRTLLKLANRPLPVELPKLSLRHPTQESSRPPNVHSGAEPLRIHRNPHPRETLP